MNIGKKAFEVAAGEEAYSGRPLTLDERETRAGELVVDVASLGLAKSKWFNRGAEKDWDWIKMPPRQRWADECGKITVSPEKFGGVENIPPSQRGLSLFDIRPSQYPNTWGEGASPGLRYLWPFGVAGAGVVGEVAR
jgi:hypothetical protein